jgi:hypothetical protein
MPVSSVEAESDPSEEGKVKGANDLIIENVCAVIPINESVVQGVQVNNGTYNHD